MCGFVALHSHSNNIRCELVDKSMQVLAHRGPDGSGLIEFEDVVFGHQRLKIIDLDGGKQPMYSPDKRYLTVFNGEIFNYLEIRAELIECGVKFSSVSDTEVLIEAVRAWGEQALSRLNGQFSFVIYDHANRSLLAARDSVGEKPLYLLRLGEMSIFASEVKALIECQKLLGQSQNLNCRLLWDYLSLNYVPHGCLVNGIETVRPGTYFRVLNGSMKEGTYRPLVDRIPAPTFSDSVEYTDSYIKRSLKYRLRSDVEVGIFLSGGIDSTAICCCLDGVKIRAYSAMFEEPGFDESPSASKVASEFGLPLTKVPIDFSTENIPQLIEELAYHGDEPLADSSALPVYLLSRAVSKQVKVVLSGDGGDELFGGYLTYLATSMANSIPKLIRQALFYMHPLLTLIPKSNSKVGLQEKLDRFIRNLDLPPGAAHVAWNGMFRMAAKIKLLSPDVLAQIEVDETFERMARFGNIDLESPKLGELMRFDQEYYLPCDILNKVDRMTMAHGLEARPVLLDPQIVNLSRRLPEEFHKLGNNNKLILKEVIRRQFPRYDLERPKQGFSIPIHNWFRTKLRSFTSDLFNSTETRQSGVFDPEQLHRIWKMHLDHRCNIGFELWGIVIFLVWMRRFGVRL